MLRCSCPDSWVAWIRTALFRASAIYVLLFASSTLLAQTIQPVIMEYTGKAEGRFEVTNNTLDPMAIVLEPKSFSIDPDGKALYRPIDPQIHLKLSAMSFRLEPQQTYYIFYKVRADQLPAWFTIYAVFSPIRKNDEGLKLRIMLPHTVYLYQKKALEKEAIHVQQAVYNPQDHMIICDLENLSSSLVRVQELRVNGGKDPVQAGGFPLLPGSRRHLEIPWEKITPPDYLIMHFPHFDMKEPLSVQKQ